MHGRHVRGTRVAPFPKCLNSRMSALFLYHECTTFGGYACSPISSGVEVLILMGDRTLGERRRSEGGEAREWETENKLCQHGCFLKKSRCWTMGTTEVWLLVLPEQGSK